MVVVWIHIFITKKCQIKKHHQLFIKLMLDSIIKAKKKYPQTLLEECKCEQKRIKTENLVDDLEKSLSDNFYNDEMEYESSK